MERENVGLVSEQTGFVAKAVLIFQKNLNHVTQRVSKCLAAVCVDIVSVQKTHLRTWFRCHMAHREGF